VDKILSTVCNTLSIHCLLSSARQGCVVLALAFGVCTCTWLPLEAEAVLQNVTIPIQCVAQNYAQIVTTRCVSDLKDTSDRNADMFADRTVKTGIALHPCSENILVLF